MAQITEIQLKSSNTRLQSQHWLNLVDALEGALQAIAKNGNIRAQLLYLFSRY